jgi:uncharacterized protein
VAQNKNRRQDSKSKERTYYVDGMHCPACEILIEKKLIELDGVRSVEVSKSRSSILIESEGQAPGVGRLNKLFRGDGYTFSTTPPVRESGSRGIGFAKIAIAVIVAVGLIILLQKAGLTRLVTVNSKSSLPAFLLLGLVAGFSSCAALVGGIVLSMSKQWGELYSPDEPLKKRMEPHLLFNTGRLISYAALGAVLALIGGTLRLSPSLSALLVIAISLVMIVLGLQMLGVRSLERFQFTMPKSITRYVADEKHFKGRYMPFAMGALTFFLPCGFTITAQSFALLSGKPLQGAMIMLFFALGTLPMLLIIAFSSVKFLEKERLAVGFLKVAGVVVLFFALFNINNQLVVLNEPNLGDLFSPNSVALSATDAKLPPISGGKQILKMNASASDYSPSNLTVRVGVPVLWEIKDTGTSGCTNSVISQDLFSGPIPLTHGTTSTKEFIPRKTGKFRFSCGMGMVTGTINVVDVKDDKGTAGGPSSVAPDVRQGGGTSGSGAQASGLPQIVNGKQVVKMSARVSSYEPDKLKVLVGVPVRWEIYDTGTDGCTHAVIAPGIFSDTIILTPYKTTVKEFVPKKLGRFSYSCSMGMVKGIIDVVDPKNPNPSKFDYDESTVPGKSGGCCG